MAASEPQVVCRAHEKVILSAVEGFRSLHRTASEQAGRKHEITGVWLPLDLKVKDCNLGDKSGITRATSVMID